MHEYLPTKHSSEAADLRGGIGGGSGGAGAFLWFLFARLLTERSGQTSIIIPVRYKISFETFG